MATPFLYCDIGSGAGLPGIVWHAMLTEAGYRPQSVLVEPRAKRAWFLERTARQLGLGEIRAVATRWGEMPRLIQSSVQARRPEDILLSIKALKMSEVEILGGLALTEEASAGRWTENLKRVTIVRFLPTGRFENIENENGTDSARESIRTPDGRKKWLRVSQRVQAFVTPEIESAVAVTVFEPKG